MCKLKEINGYIKLTLDKLLTISADQIQTDDNWQEWDSWSLIKAIRNWTDRNPVPLKDKQKLNPTEKQRLYQTGQYDWTQKFCIYCSKKSHKSNDCKTITRTRKFYVRKGYVLIAPELNMEQLIVELKEPVKHLKLNFGLFKVKQLVFL